MNEGLKLKLITPAGMQRELDCDAVNMVACDNAEGFGGGSVGIRKGHMPAVIALENDSIVSAKSNGIEVLCARVAGGFASVKENIVTVITPAVIEEE